MSLPGGVPRCVVGQPAPASVPSLAREAYAFHRALPGYQPSPIVDAGELARSLGVRRLIVKDESSRFGLPAFKYLGASWAVERALRGDDTVDRLAAATDGNHGRAVARIAKQRGLRATIFVPSEMAPSRLRAIESEGAKVVVVNGGYDECVRLAAAESDDSGCRVIADADLDDSSPVPGYVIDGYATVFLEVEEQLAARGAGRASLVMIQVGVGAFAATATRWAIEHGARAVVGVEPAGAACLSASLAAGHPVTVDATPTCMAGLFCGSLSLAAWPTLRAGLSGSVTVSDDEADDAMRLLATVGVEAGESGAAGLAGLVALLVDPACRDLRDRLPEDALECVVVINTEAATDPERYARVVGTPPGARAT